MRLVNDSNAERGDTIIEVIFAIVIFSFIAISSLAIMNQGVATGEKALEITLVRQQINAQAEALRYIHEALVVNPSSSEAVAWNDIVSKYGQSAASPYGVDEDKKCRVPTTDAGFKPFILNARTARVWPTGPSITPSADSNFPPYTQVVYNESVSSIKVGYGLWVEAVVWPGDPAEK